MTLAWRWTNLCLKGMPALLSLICILSASSAIFGLTPSCCGMTTIEEAANMRSFVNIQSAWAYDDNKTSASALTQSAGAMRINITSPLVVNGTTGQIIAIKGTISNLEPAASAPAAGIAYISIVDTTAKVPIDLEDWSAEKGLYIPAIAGGQSLPLNWNVRLVKAGNYTVDVLFNKEDGARGGSGSIPPHSQPSSISSSSSLLPPPITSQRIVLEVAPKLNLNPGNVLPVAFATPAALIAILALINYIRGRRVGIYR